MRRLVAETIHRSAGESGGGVDGVAYSSRNRSLKRATFHSFVTSLAPACTFSSLMMASFPTPVLAAQYRAASAEYCSSSSSGAIGPPPRLLLIFPAPSGASPHPEIRIDFQGTVSW